MLTMAAIIFYINNSKSDLKYYNQIVALGREIGLTIQANTSYAVF